LATRLTDLLPRQWAELSTSVIYFFHNLFEEISEKRGAPPMVKEYELIEALRDVAKEMGGIEFKIAGRQPALLTPGCNDKN
jgi:hypothetical protein